MNIGNESTHKGTDAVDHEDQVVDVGRLAFADLDAFEPAYDEVRQHVLLENPQQ